MGSLPSRGLKSKWGGNEKQLRRHKALGDELGSNSQRWWCWVIFRKGTGIVWRWGGRDRWGPYLSGCDTYWAADLPWGPVTPCESGVNTRRGAICSNMDGPRECHDEWSQSDREGTISYDIHYTWNLKRNDTNELTKQKETPRLREHIYGCQGKGYWERIVREFGMDMYILLSLKRISKKVNVMWQPGQEGVRGRMDVRVYMTESLCCAPEAIRALLTGYITGQRKYFFIFLRK